MSDLLIEHPDVRRGRHVVLYASCLRMPLPGALAVVGLNGSGKTTLFMQLTGTLAGARRAAVTIDGRVPALAYVPQHAALPAWLAVDDAVRLYGLELSGLQECLPQLYLDELAGQRCGSLSAGQRQALAIAIALGLNAPLTLLDEPFAALDFRRRTGVIARLRERIGRPDRGVILSSQSAADLRPLCSHYLVLHGGRCVFSGTREQLTRGQDEIDADERRLLQILSRADAPGGLPASAMETPRRPA
ncbi:MAG: ATP-binding cassette domain-containing protein [Gemmatimonadota bacterium]